MIARDRSSSQIARSASTVALASRPGGGVPTHFRYTPCIVMSSSTGDSNPRSPDYGGAPVQLAARAATDAAIAKLGTPVVASTELDERFPACLGRTWTPASSSKSASAAILTACGSHLRTIPLFVPAEAPGLDLPGSAEATPSILLPKLPSRLAARQRRCQVVWVFSRLVRTIRSSLIR